MGASNQETKLSGVKKMLSRGSLPLDARLNLGDNKTVDEMECFSNELKIALLDLSSFTSDSIINIVNALLKDRINEETKKIGDLFFQQTTKSCFPIEEKKLSNYEENVIVDAFSFSLSYFESISRQNNANGVALNDALTASQFEKKAREILRKDWIVLRQFDKFDSERNSKMHYKREESIPYSAGLLPEEAIVIRLAVAQYIKLRHSSKTWSETKADAFPLLRIALQEEKMKFDLSMHDDFVTRMLAKSYLAKRAIGHEFEESNSAIRIPRDAHSMLKRIGKATLFLKESNQSTTDENIVDIVNRDGYKSKLSLAQLNTLRFSLTLQFNPMQYNDEDIPEADVFDHLMHFTEIPSATSDCIIDIEERATLNTFLAKLEDRLLEIDPKGLLLLKIISHGINNEKSKLIFNSSGKFNYERIATTFRDSNSSGQDHSFYKRHNIEKFINNVLRPLAQELLVEFQSGKHE